MSIRKPYSPMVSGSSGGEAGKQRSSVMPNVV